MFSSVVSSAAGAVGAAGGLGGIAGGTLMTAPTSTYSALYAKYGGFELPEVKISVDGTAISSKNADKIMVNNVTVELSSEYEAAMASFRFYNVFDVSRSIFLFTDVDKYVQIGKKVTISLGYSGVTEDIFTGFIAGADYVYERGGVPYIEVTCMDVKGLMMSNAYSKQLKGKSYSACVSELLGKAAYTKLGISQSVDRTEDEAREIEMVDESDYEFIVKAAEKFAYEFFVIQNKVYFRKPKSQTAPIMKMSFGNGILYADVGYSLTGMVKKIEARSANSGTGKLVSASANIKGKYADSSSASSLLTDTQKIYVDPTITTQQEAQTRAKALVEQLSYRFASVNAECVGIPNLIPGRFVEFSQMGKNISNKFYITQAKHCFDTENGYTTTLTAKAATL